jgi:hypothetical protein
VTEFLARRLAEKVRAFERRLGQPHEPGRGRGCCGRCFTPWMCARPLHHDEPCICHLRSPRRLSLYLTLDDVMREAA